MVIIGITGTNGAGKGTIVEYLVNKLGFVHYSVKDYLTEKVIEENLPINRESMILIGNKLRRKYGPSFVVEQLYAKALKSRRNCIIESIRTSGEVEFLKKTGKFILLAVDAGSKTRYERVKSRNSEKDQISYEKFCESEDNEMHSSDPNKQNLSACIKIADYLINNDSTIENLNKQLIQLPFSHHPRK